MPAVATLCDGCHHPEDEHHIKKENWLECFHPGCNCESYKGFAYWNERENIVDIDHSARLAEGQKRWGSENARPFRCSCGGIIEKVSGEDDRFECGDCGQLYEKDDWRSDILKAVQNRKK